MPRPVAHWATGFFFAMSDAIIARQVRKSFGEVQAVRDVSFDVAGGECFGLLGPNGAGKTTTMSLIRCVSPPDGGQIKVLGRDVRRRGRAIRSRLGVVPQHDSLDPDLTVLDNLRLYAACFGIRNREARGRASELLRFMALEDKARVRIDRLSGGMRRRLLVARGLINRPDMLILDEPTTGLDPQSRHHIWQRLRSLKAAGTTMLLSTHTMDEAERLCDRLAIIDHGRVLATGSPEALIRQHAGAEVIEIDMPSGSLPAELQAELDELLPPGTRQERHENTLTCSIPPDQPLPTDCAAAARAAGLRVTTRRAGLEDVFLNLTGRELRE